MVLIKLMRDRVVQVTAASLPALLAFPNTSILSPLIPFLFKHIEANYGDIIVLSLQALVWGVCWLEGAVFLLPLFELVSYLRGPRLGSLHQTSAQTCCVSAAEAIVGVWSLVRFLWWLGFMEGCSCCLRHGGLRAGVVIGPPGLDWSMVGMHQVERCSSGVAFHKLNTSQNHRLAVFIRVDLLSRRHFEVLSPARVDPWFTDHQQWHEWMKTKWCFF